jgi:hypothetical protein
MRQPVRIAIGAACKARCVGVVQQERAVRYEQLATSSSATSASRDEREPQAFPHKRLCSTAFLCMVLTVKAEGHNAQEPQAFLHK